MELIVQPDIQGEQSFEFFCGWGRLFDMKQGRLQRSARTRDEELHAPGPSAEQLEEDPPPRDFRYRNLGLCELGCLAKVDLNINH